MMPPPADDLLAVAHVLRPHGVRGEVSCVVPVPAVLDVGGLLRGRKLLLRAPGDAHGSSIREVGVEGARPHQDRWLVKLVGIDSMTDAETLRNHDLCLPRGELPALPEGWFWEADLAGCRVLDVGRGELGTAVRLELSSAQPLLVVARDAAPDLALPWVKAYVQSVDLISKTIRIDLPAGFPGLGDEEEDSSD